MLEGRRFGKVDIEEQLQSAANVLRWLGGLIALRRNMKQVFVNIYSTGMQNGEEEAV
jgi:hypothetical protein